MGRKLTFEVTVPEGLKPGDKFQAEVELPTSPMSRRGQLAGLSLEEMTDDQLKREIINAKSVLYKATKRGASEETIAKNEARVEAALAEKARRDAMKKETEATEEDIAEDVPVDFETADEI
ncbi:MAG: hypothetical protein GX892_07805 [Thermoanaerobacteraceae bacterium]|nr:hypothetical protein [Thermoanaerobacteraceae bacterium]